MARVVKWIGIVVGAIALTGYLVVREARRYSASQISAQQQLYVEARAQTFGDFEFIAVDDGSSDHSLPLLQRLAHSDSRLRIISRPNTGIVGALNDGLGPRAIWFGALALGIASAAGLALLARRGS